MEIYNLTTTEGIIIFILISGFLGFVGGLGSILLSGYTPSHWIEKDGKKVKYVFGSIKEPFIGFLGGILIPLTLESQVSDTILIYTSLLAGFGSSNLLQQYIAKKTKEIVNTSVSEFNAFKVTTEEEIKNEVIEKEPNKKIN